MRALLRFVSLLAIGFSALPTGASAAVEESFRERLQPVPRDSGFHQEGYYVWCGSAIKVGATYHLFAARWPKSTGFPEGYRTHSEIVRATADNPLGPYVFQDVVVGQRDPAFWDSAMAHNPTIHKIGDTFVLFYIGSDGSTVMPGTKTLARAIGYATAKNIAGPWTRSAQPIIPADANNPAIALDPSGQIRLLYRDAQLRVVLAEADSYVGPYRTINDNVWPQSCLEDFYLYRTATGYHFICEDNVGVVTGHVRWGAHFISPRGINDWKPAEDLIAYDHTIVFTDGTRLECNRRERPQLLIEDGHVTHLFTAVFDGQNAWSQPVPLRPTLSVERE